jgi:uncharacterized protein with von Willebrand factor type A (vWA) domain
MSAVAQGVKVHTFYSRGRGEKLIRQPLLLAETALGRQIKQQERVAYDFAPDGRLEVYEGQDRLADGPLDPETMQPTVQDAVAWLTSHPLLNERFWHEGHEPGRLLPTEDDFLGLLAEHTALLQAEPIQVMLEQERSTHARSVLLGACERALAAIDATREALRREQEREAQEAAGEPAGG